MPRHRHDATPRDAIESPDNAQAALLRAELWRHIEELSRHLEQAESGALGPTGSRHRQAQLMRAELYEAHNLIDALNRRFPASDSSSTS